MLDRYWYGQIKSPATDNCPPVLCIKNTKDVAGGAANVAINTVNLGLKTTLLSALGYDAEGDLLQLLVTSSGVTGIFLRDTRMQTTVKIRLIDENLPLLRADFEQKRDPTLLKPLLDSFCEQVTLFNTVVFSDYGKGCLAHLSVMMEHAKNAGACILIDPKGRDYSTYHGATVLTPNKDEFIAVAGVWADRKDFERRAFALRDQLKLEALLITRAEEGMSLFFENRHIRVHSQARKVVDVCGAGDTVIATMAAALSAGKGMEDAVYLAARAADIVVGKFGTTPITLDEITDYV